MSETNGKRGAELTDRQCDCCGTLLYRWEVEDLRVCGDGGRRCLTCVLSNHCGCRPVTGVRGGKRCVGPAR
jgi:hypothetical protein